MPNNSSATTHARHRRDGPIDSRLPYFEAPRSLPGFWNLPKELRERITLMACSDPLPRGTIIGRSQDCTETMLRLVQTSKFFYMSILPLLYKHIRITKPSTLAAFHAALTSRPSLTHLVKSLHIGTDKVLAGDWFPLHQAQCGQPGHLAFRIKLDGEGSDSARAYHDHELQEPSHSEEELVDPSTQALHKAIVSAEKAFDINLRRHGSSRSRREIGIDAWYIRVIEMQAALEIYFFEVRRREEVVKSGRQTKEAEGRRTRSSDSAKMSYPSLVVAVNARKPSQGNVITVTRSQILAHLSRPGSLTDAFDHPLLFARSNLVWHAKDIDGAPHEGGLEDNEVFGGEEIPDAFHPPDYSWREDETPPTYEDPWELFALALNNGTTVGANVALARSILAFTRDLHSLSLTGIFHHLLVDGRTHTHNFLRSATVGPAPPGWYEPLELNHPTFVCLEKLRLCDEWLLDGRITDLLGGNGGLPRLKKFQWSMVREYSRKEISSVVGFALRLAGLEESAPAAASSSNEASGQTHKRSRRSFESEELLLSEDEGAGDQDRASGRRDLYIELLLHPNDVERIIKAAPTPAIAAAWRSGEALPRTRRRMRVAAHPTPSVAHEPDEADNEAVQGQYNLGRTWWEEGW